MRVTNTQTLSPINAWWCDLVLHFVMDMDPKRRDFETTLCVHVACAATTTPAIKKRLDQTFKMDCFTKYVSLRKVHTYPENVQHVTYQRGLETKRPGHAGPRTLFVPTVQGAENRNARGPVSTVGSLYGYIQTVPLVPLRDHFLHFLLEFTSRLAKDGDG